MFEATLEIRLPNNRVFRVHSPAAYEAPEGDPWLLAAWEPAANKPGDVDNPDYQADDTATMARLLTEGGGWDSKADEQDARKAIAKMLASLL